MMNYRCKGFLMEYIHTGHILWKLNVCSSGCFCQLVRRGYQQDFMQPQIDHALCYRTAITSTPEAYTTALVNTVLDPDWSITFPSVCIIVGYVCTLSYVIFQ